MSRRRKLIGLAAVVTVVVASAFMLWPQAKEPTRVDLLARELGAKENWFHRWVNARKGRLRANMSSKLSAAARQAQIGARNRQLDAFQELARMGTNAWPAIPGLLETLEDKELLSRIYAAEVLVATDAVKAPEWPELSKRLYKRFKPAEAFFRMMDGKSSFEMPYWLRIQQDTQQDALPGSRAGPVIVAVPRPLPQLRQQFALEGLKTTGPAAAIALPELEKIIRSKAPYERRVAVLEVIGNLGNAAASPIIPLLQELADNPDEWPQVRAAAMQALADVTPNRKLLVNRLRSNMTDESAFVRIGAACALWKLEARPGEVLPVLTNALTHKLVSVRVAALQALEQMGRDAAPTRDLVQRFADDENPSVRNTATRVLKRME